MSQKKSSVLPLRIPGKNSYFKQSGVKPAGFLYGLWHGIVFPILALVWLFTDNVEFVETNNNGTWYKIGFFIGAVGSVGGSSSQAR